MEIAKSLESDYKKMPLYFFYRSDSFLSLFCLSESFLSFFCLSDPFLSFWQVRVTKLCLDSLLDPQLSQSSFIPSKPLHQRDELDETRTNLHFLTFLLVQLLPSLLFRCVLASHYEGLSVRPSVRPSVSI